MWWRNSRANNVPEIRETYRFQANPDLTPETAVKCSMFISLFLVRFPEAMEYWKSEPTIHRHFVIEPYSGR
jgi:hypothetical protein